MDGIGGTLKNLVCRRVLSEDVVINIPQEFEEFANQINSVYCLFLKKSEFVQEPEAVSQAMPIPWTLKFHIVSHARNGSH